MKNILESRIGFGTYKILNQDKMNDAIKWASMAGYDFIDTAKLYRTEELIGNAINKIRKETPKLKIPLLQSKIWPSDFKNGVRNEILASFKRLGDIKVIDSFLLHRPHVNNDMNVKAWKELIACKKEGLVKHIGLSNFEPDMIRILYNETKVMPELLNNEASVTYIRKDRIIHAKKHNIILQGWRPFGNPIINFKHPLLIEMAKKYKCSIAQIMVAYSIYFGFAPVPRSEIKSEIFDNILGLNIKLDTNDVALIEITLNENESTTHNKCDSYANLSLDDDWYKNN